jgi:hypothetical protein
LDKSQFRERYQEAFYASLQESKIEIADLPAPQLQALCKAFADASFAVLHQLDEAPKAAPVASEAEEQLLWSAKSELKLGLRYELTSQRLRIFQGMLGRSLHEVDLITVREAKMTQHLGERLVNIGDVILVTTSPEHPEVRLEDVKNPMEVRELIRKAYMAEQKRRGLKFQDQS